MEIIAAIGEFIEIEPGKLASKVKLRAASASSVENTMGTRWVFGRTFVEAHSRNRDSDMMAMNGTNRRSMYRVQSRSSVAISVMRENGRAFQPKKVL